MNNRSITLTVLHTNDIHAAIDDFPKVAEYIETERSNNQHFLYLDAGDIFSGNPVVDLNYGKPIVDLLNEMKLDAMTIGNHDFDYGQDYFSINRKEANFPWLGANISIIDAKIPIKQPDPYKIFIFNEVKVGVIGFIETPPSTIPKHITGLDFKCPLKTAEQYKELREQVDILIALSHLGIDGDRQLAKHYDIFDVIIGGHSHTVIHPPEICNDTPIVHTCTGAKFIGNLSICIDSRTKKIRYFESKLQSVNELKTENKNIKRKVDQYFNILSEKLQTVIGITNTGLSHEGSNQMDVSLGNFCTDAIKTMAKADMALMNNLWSY